MKQLWVLFFLILALNVYAQQLFADQCIGVWKGTMQLYAKSKLMDSVPVVLTVKKQTDTSWMWKTEYLSTKLPMTKDYVLRLKDKKNQIYAIDEGQGVELIEYLYANQLYSVFETEGVLLASTYQMDQSKLIFEVLASKKIVEEKKQIANYQITSVQKVVLTRIE